MAGNLFYLYQCNFDRKAQICILSVLHCGDGTMLLSGLPFSRVCSE